MKNKRLCSHSCSNCKYALAVEDFDNVPSLYRPDTFATINGMAQDMEMERRAALGIFEHVTPIKTLCYLPEGKDCAVDVRIDRSPLPTNIFIEQMTDLYECIPPEQVAQFIAQDLQKQSQGKQLTDKEQCWLTIHKNIYERATGRAYDERTT